MRKTVHSKVIQPYVDHLNRVLNKTITQSRLDTIESEAAFVVITRFQQAEVTPLELSGGKWLHFRQLVIEQDNKIDVLEAHYIFSLSQDPDHEESHIFRWEFIREPPAPHVPQSHLHIYGQNPHAQNLSRVHFPTRRLSVEQIIWLLIQEWDVTPQSENWYAILQRGHRDFLRRTVETERTLLPFP